MLPESVYYSLKLRVRFEFGIAIQRPELILQRIGKSAGMTDNIELKMEAMKSGQILRCDFCLQRPAAIEPDFQSGVDWGDYVPLVCQRHPNCVVGLTKSPSLRGHPNPANEVHLKTGQR